MCHIETGDRSEAITGGPKKKFVTNLAHFLTKKGPRGLDTAKKQNLSRGCQLLTKRNIQEKISGSKVRF